MDKDLNIKHILGNYLEMKKERTDLNTIELKGDEGWGLRNEDGVR